jgi:hypothetical protein
MRHVRAPHVLAKLGLGEECGFKQSLNINNQIFKEITNLYFKLLI